MKSERYRKTVVLLSIVTLTAYMTWRSLFTMPSGYGTIVMICAVIMLICELLSGLEMILHLLNSLHIDEPELPVIDDNWYPDIDVFIATHNEPEDVLYKTVNGCRHMKYPDKSKVHIWLCDDGFRESVRNLAEEMGVGYQGLKNNKLAKAGNLNHAIANTDSPLIATFDADMIPTRNFLIRTVPYFFLPRMKKNDQGRWVERTDEEINPEYKIGFIQTPQSFYNPDLFQYNLYSEDSIPNEQDYFFREINVSRNRNNAPIYAGSNTLISREALVKAGGIATGTITEDFETGIHIQDEGYSCYATSEPLAHGLAPDTIDSLIKQRERWGRGCVYSLRRINIWKDKKMSFGSKISYFSCELYWWSYFRRFVFTLAPILFVLFNIPVIVCKPWQMLLFWLPSYIMGIIAARAVSSEIRNSRWSNIIDTILFPYLITSIFLESIGIRKRNFHVTEKTRTVNTDTDMLLALPHIILTVMSVLAVFKAFGQMIEYESLGPLILLFWLIMNLSALIMAVFFMMGRNNMRTAERYQVDIPVCIDYKKKMYGETCDISETGFSVVFDKPVPVPKYHKVNVNIRTHHYSANMKANIVYVDQRKDGLRYCFEIKELKEPDKGEYFQMIYDREPSLPDKIDCNAGVFNEFSTNVLMHAGSSCSASQRKNFRIKVNEWMSTRENIDIFVDDFNYRYLLIGKLKEQSEIPDHLHVQPFDDRSLEFDIEYRRKFSDGRMLYFITNHSEISFSDRVNELVDRWIEKTECEHGGMENERTDVRFAQ